MAQNQKLNKQDQSLVSFVEQLKDLNNIEVKVKQANIKGIIQDPQQYALDSIEEVFVKYFKNAIKSFKLGDEFAKDLLENGKKRL